MTTKMNKTIFEISKMDCPSEENLIRMKLDGIQEIKNLDFDIPNRKLTVFHDGHNDQIEKSIIELNLGGKKISTEETNKKDFVENTNQKKLLWIVLAINFVFFIIEMTTGLISKSMGLVADSLDMLADSFVYGISLFAVGGTLIKKKRIAKIAGYFQITLAIIGFVGFIERGQRRIAVHYAKRQQGRKVFAAQTSHLPLKVNMAGVIPAIFASSILLFPASLGSWFGQSEGLVL